MMILINVLCIVFNAKLNFPIEILGCLVIFVYKGLYYCDIELIWLNTKIQLENTNIQHP